MAALHEPRKPVRQYDPMYRLPHGIRARRRPPEAVADEVDFFGWYYGIAPDSSCVGWPPAHRNRMAERLCMNRKTLDQAIARARQRQENEDDPPFYRLSPAPRKD